MSCDKFPLLISKLIEFR